MSRLALIITLFWSIGQAKAHEAKDGRIHFSLGSFTHQTHFKNERNEVDAPLQGSFGFTINGDVDSYSGFEIGGFFLNKIFMREKGPSVLVEKTKRAYMTVGYRHWFTKNFGLGISSFTSYSMGDPRRIYSTTGTDPGFKTSAHDTSDHGLDISVLYESLKLSKGSIITDLRYSKSFSGREGEDGNHMGVFIAYKVRAK